MILHIINLRSPQIITLPSVFYHFVHSIWALPPYNPHETTRSIQGLSKYVWILVNFEFRSRTVIRDEWKPSIRRIYVKVLYLRKLHSWVPKSTNLLQFDRKSLDVSEEIGLRFADGNWSSNPPCSASRSAYWIYSSLRWFIGQQSNNPDHLAVVMGAAHPTIQYFSHKKLIYRTEDPVTFLIGLCTWGRSNSHKKADHPAAEIDS